LDGLNHSLIVDGNMVYYSTDNAFVASNGTDAGTVVKNQLFIPLGAKNNQVFGISSRLAISNLQVYSTSNSTITDLQYTEPFVKYDHVFEYDNEIYVLGFLNNNMHFIRYNSTSNTLSQLGIFPATEIRTKQVIPLNKSLVFFTNNSKGICFINMTNPNQPEFLNSKNVDNGGDGDIWTREGALLNNKFYFEADKGNIGVTDGTESGSFPYCKVSNTTNITVIGTVNSTLYVLQGFTLYRINGVSNAIASVEVPNNIQAFPNPAHNELHLTHAFPNEVHCAFYNELGMLVHNQTLQAHETALDIAPLRPGFYVVKIGSDENRMRIAFIKQ